MASEREVLMTKSALMAVSAQQIEARPEVKQSRRMTFELSEDHLMDASRRLPVPEGGTWDEVKQVLQSEGTPARTMQLKEDWSLFRSGDKVRVSFIRDIKDPKQSIYKFESVNK